MMAEGVKGSSTGVISTSSSVGGMPGTLSSASTGTDGIQVSGGQHARAKSGGYLGLVFKT